MSRSTAVGGGENSDTRRMWTWYARQTLLFLPFFHPAQLADVLQCFAQAGCRHPFVFQAVFEALFWQFQLGRVRPVHVTEALRAALAVKFVPAEHHFAALLQVHNKNRWYLKGRDAAPLALMAAVARAATRTVEQSALSPAQDTYFLKPSGETDTTLEQVERVAYASVGSLTDSRSTAELATTLLLTKTIEQERLVKNFIAALQRIASKMSNEDFRAVLIALGNARQSLLQQSANQLSSILNEFFNENGLEAEVETAAVATYFLHRSKVRCMELEEKIDTLLAHRLIEMPGPLLALVLQQHPNPRRILNCLAPYFISSRTLSRDAPLRPLIEALESTEASATKQFEDIDPAGRVQRRSAAHPAPAPPLLQLADSGVCVAVAGELVRQRVIDPGATSGPQQARLEGAMAWRVPTGDGAQDSSEPPILPLGNSAHKPVAKQIDNVGEICAELVSGALSLQKLILPSSAPPKAAPEEGREEAAQEREAFLQERNVVAACLSGPLAGGSRVHETAGAATSIFEIIRASEEEEGEAEPPVEGAAQGGADVVSSSANVEDIGLFASGNSDARAAPTGGHAAPCPTGFRVTEPHACKLPGRWRRLFGSAKHPAERRLLRFCARRGIAWRDAAVSAVSLYDISNLAKGNAPERRRKLSPKIFQKYRRRLRLQQRGGFSSPDGGVDMLRNARRAHLRPYRQAAVLDWSDMRACGVTCFEPAFEIRGSESGIESAQKLIGQGDYSLALNHSENRLDAPAAAVVGCALGSFGVRSVPPTVGALLLQMARAADWHQRPITSVDLRPAPHVAALIHIWASSDLSSEGAIEITGEEPGDGASGGPGAGMRADISTPATRSSLASGVRQLRPPGIQPFIFNRAKCSLTSLSSHDLIRLLSGEATLQQLLLANTFVDTLPFALPRIRHGSWRRAAKCSSVERRCWRTIDGQLRRARARRLLAAAAGVALPRATAAEMRAAAWAAPMRHGRIFARRFRLDLSRDG